MRLSCEVAALSALMCAGSRTLTVTIVIFDVYLSAGYRRVILISVYSEKRGRWTYRVSAFLGHVIWGL